MQQSSSEVLQLNEKDFLTKGSHNLVYRHPSESEYLVKVLGIVKVLGLIKEPGVVKGLGDRFNNSNWIGTSKLMRSINQFRLKKAYIREFIEILRLKFHDEFLSQPPIFMQKLISFTDTNLGFAMIVKAEKDSSGNYAPTLTNLIENNFIDEKVLQHLDLFFQQILTYDFILNDVHTDNIVYAYSKTHGHHFVLIDGIGDKTILPLLRISKYLRLKSKKRVIRRINACIANNSPA